MDALVSTDFRNRSVLVGAISFGISGTLVCLSGEATRYIIEVGHIAGLVGLLDGGSITKKKLQIIQAGEMVKVLQPATGQGPGPGNAGDVITATAGAAAVTLRIRALSRGLRFLLPNSSGWSSRTRWTSA